MKFVFFLRFDFKLSPFTKSNEWTYLLHLAGSNGEWIPVVYYNAKQSRLRVVFAEGGYRTSYNFKEPDRTKWTRIEISQKKVLSIHTNTYYYIHSLKIDNDEKYYMKLMSRAKEFFGVKVYLSNPSMTPAEGSIRNIFINPEGKTIDPFTVKVTQYTLSLL